MNRVFGDILKDIRLSRSMSQDEFAELLGTTKQVISRYENNLRTPKITIVKEYADILQLSLAYLLGDDTPAAQKSIFSLENVLPLPNMKKVPRLGTIACGEPILAEGNIDTYDAVPENIRCDFSLCCKGESMINARIFDGDIVYIRAQPEVENGQIAAVRIGEDATLKKVYYAPEGGRIVLRACNPLFADLVYEDDALDEVQVLGLAVGFYSNVRHK